MQSCYSSDSVEGTYGRSIPKAKTGLTHKNEATSIV